MSMTAIEGEVRAYLSALRAHLKDLPDDERDDLLEDLEQHLTEVRAEGEGSLIERLGPPDVYAAELRTSVGVTASPTSRLARFINGVKKNPVVGRVRMFLPEVRPGWWVLCGLLAVAAVTAIIWNRDQSAITEVTQADEYVAEGYLSHNGNPITNICPYDKNGKALKGVLLFDQSGGPITEVAPFSPNGLMVERFPGVSNGGIANAYPRKLKVTDPNTGAQTTLKCPSVIVAAAAP